MRACALYMHACIYLYILHVYLYIHTLCIHTPYIRLYTPRAHIMCLSVLYRLNNFQRNFSRKRRTQFGSLTFFVAEFWSFRIRFCVWFCFLLWPSENCLLLFPGSWYARYIYIKDYGVLEPLIVQTKTAIQIRCVGAPSSLRLACTCMSISQSHRHYYISKQGYFKMYF